MEKDVRISQDNNATLLLGVVSSDLKLIENPHSQSLMVTFMMETEREGRIEKHKIVCFDSLAKKMKYELKQGMSVLINGCNRSKIIKSNNVNQEDEGKQTIMSRDVIAKKVSIIEGKVEGHINQTILLGTVISEVKHSKSFIGPVSYFTLQTEESFYSEKKSGLVKTRERHKIVCFDDMSEIIKDKNISVGDKIFLLGENQSKLLTNEDGDRYIIREVVATTISPIS